MQPDELIWYVDGAETRRIARSIAKPMYILINNTIGGGWPGDPDPTTPWPAQMQIDYVRVFSKTAPSQVLGPRGSPGLIVDNAQATATGSWTASTFATGQYYGANYLHDGNTGKGSKTMRFTPNLSSAGNYNVYAIWNGSVGRATNVPYTFTYSGGSATVTKNQSAGGGQWNFLGNYPFNAGIFGNVLLSNAGTTGFVIADALQFVPAVATQVVLDAENTILVTKSGTWTASSVVPGYVGNSYFFDGNSTKGPGQYVRFNPTLPSNGTYKVYMRWTSNSGRASSAPVDILRADGTTLTVNVDQRSNGSKWNFLGTCSLSNSNVAVTLRTNGTTGAVIADAMRFVKQ